MTAMSATMIEVSEVMAERREWWATRYRTVEAVARHLKIPGRDLGRLLGVSQSTISKKLAGVVRLEPWELDALAHVLGVPEYVLWSEPNDAIRWILDHPDEVVTRGVGASGEPGTCNRCFVGIPGDSMELSPFFATRVGEMEALDGDPTAAIEGGPIAAIGGRPTAPIVLRPMQSESHIFSIETPVTSGDQPCHGCMTGQPLKKAA